jgi:hypothetical protein
MSNMLLEKQQEQESTQDELYVITTLSACMPMVWSVSVWTLIMSSLQFLCSYSEY